MGARWFLQVGDATCCFGFRLLDEAGTNWCAGCGGSILPHAWTMVPAEDVPDEVRARFEWLLRV